MSILKVSIRQIKAARAMLGWSQTDLAQRSGVSEPTIKRLEASEGNLGGRTDTAEKIVEALSSAGVIFLDGAYSGAGGPGVRLAAPSSSIDVDENQVVQYPENLENDAPPGAGG